MFSIVATMMIGVHLNLYVPGSIDLTYKFQEHFSKIGYVKR